MTQGNSTINKNIVILGGSYGGVSIAHYLLKHALPAFPQKETYKIILISAASEAMCRQACPRAPISDDFFPQAKLFVSIAKEFEQYSTDSFQFVQGFATTVDHIQRAVTIRTVDEQTQTLDFYALIIATGASTPSPLFGLNRDEKYLRKAWVSNIDVQSVC